MPARLVTLISRLRSPLGTLDGSLAHFAGTATTHAGIAPMRWFWLDGLFANISGNFYASFIGLFALAYGATNVQVGQLGSFTGLLGLLALFPGARAIDLVGRRKPVVLWSGGGLARVALLLWACVPWITRDPALAISAMTLFSGVNAFANNFCNPAWTSLTADIVPQQIRGRFFSHRNLVINLAVLPVVPLAGWLIKAGNGIAPLFGFQLVFFCAFAVGMVATVCYARIDEPAGANTAQSAQGWRAIAGAIRKAPGFLGFTASALAWNMGVQVGAAFFTLYLAGPLGATPSTIGLLAAVQSGVALLSQRRLGRLVDRRGSAWVQGVFCLLMPLMALAWLVISAPWQVVFVNIAAGVLWTGYGLANFNLLLEMAPAEARAGAVAFYQFVVALSAVVGPLAGGVLADTIGYKPLFVVSAAGRWMGALLFFWFVVRPLARRNRTPRQQQPAG